MWQESEAKAVSTCHCFNKGNQIISFQLLTRLLVFFPPKHQVGWWYKCWDAELHCWVKKNDSMSACIKPRQRRDIRLKEDKNLLVLRTQQRGVNIISLSSSENPKPVFSLFVLLNTCRSPRSFMLAFLFVLIFLYKNSEYYDGLLSFFSNFLFEYNIKNIERPHHNSFT